jgi:GDP-mannose transporter
MSIKTNNSPTASGDSSSKAQQQTTDVEMARPLVNGITHHAEHSSTPRAVASPHNRTVTSPSNTTINTTATHEHDNSKAAHSKVVSSCLLYSFCSVSMVLTNKSLASSYNHLTDGDLNILLVVFQAIVAVICVEICKFMKWVEYPDFNLRTARLWAPVNVLFCLMLFTGMMSLQYNSVPMVTIFKNVTNILVTVGDYYCFGQVPEMLVLVAFGVMLSGAIAAAWNDISVSPQGLFWMAANCCSTAGYVLYLKFATKNVKLSKFGMVFYNNVLCTFFLLPAAIGMGQVTSFLQTPAIHTADYFTKNAFAGFVGFFLNFASLTCVAATGPTTYAIIGSLNKVPVAILGYILFDNIITAETWFFISVSMCGGFLYSYAKIQAGRKKALHQHPNDENEK